MQALNEQYLSGNRCFGCGLDNPEGLHIRIYRDGDRTDRLVGTYTPRETHGGFPQVTHGGVQFAALDCMAGWVTLILRSSGRLMPLTTKASIGYHRPARLGAELHLSAEIVHEGPPLGIKCEIRDVAGQLLTDGDFEYVLVPEKKFCGIVGVQQLPSWYERHFAEFVPIAR